MTEKEFINLLSEKIDNIKNFPVLKSLAIAQACLESRFGQKHFYNNYFGIKCHNPDLYAGCRLGKTSEVINGQYQHNLNLAFQTYNNIDECLEDYARIMNLPRYKPVREAKDYLEATQKIKDCGYATSLTYINSLRKIIKDYKLYQLDKPMKQDYFITPHFKYSEFKCKDGTDIPDNLMLNVEIIANQLEILRVNIGNKPITITSGYRTPEYNKKVGGKPNSYHLRAEAVDIKVAGIKPSDLAIYAARYTGFNGFGIADTFLHLDLRTDEFRIFKY